MSLVLEKLYVGRHDVEMAAELAYGADQTLLSLMFGGKATATGRIACLIRAGGTVFGHEHVYVALESGKVLGVAIAGTGAEYEKADRKGFRPYYRCLSITGTLRLMLVLPLIDRVLTDSLEADDFYVGILAVDADRRGRGIGSFIMDNIARIARQQGCKRLVLDVSFENPRARKFYERLGFQCTGKRPLIPGWEKIGTCTMVKML